MTTVYATLTPPALDPGETKGSSPAYCVDNIGAQGRKARWRFGWLAFVFGLALAVALLLAGAPWWLRLVVYLPFAVAGVNWRQALEKT
jgi:hypothetical protein